MSNNPTYQIVGRANTYTDGFMRVETRTFIPPFSDDRQQTQSIVVYPHVVAAVVSHPDKGLSLLWRCRLVTGAMGYEVAGGTVEPGEDPATAAARETREETGWEPVGQMRHLITFSPMPGWLDTKISVYCCDNLRQVGMPDNNVQLVWMQPDDVRERLGTENFHGAGTIVGLQTY